MRYILWFVQGEHVETGVACTLLTVSQGFDCEPYPDAWFRFSVGEEARRCLPAACRETLPEVPPDGHAD